MITIQEQQKLLLSISRRLKKQITVYAIGGNAMMFQGFKEATLDVDLVFETDKDRDVFKQAIKEIGYQEIDSILAYGTKKNRPTMLTLGKERIDLFVVQVIHFDFSKQMMKRAEQIHQFGENLIIRVADLHDIILMKCATDRQKDIDDVRNIIENKTIDWNTVISEAKNQINLGKEDAAFELGIFLEKLKYQLKVDIPVKVLDELFAIVQKQSEEKQTSA